MMLLWAGEAFAETRGVMAVPGVPTLPAQGPVLSAVTDAIGRAAFAGFRVAPVLEFRSGFPYVLDSRFSKDIRVSPKYLVRFSVSGYNLTDHFNPEAVHANIAGPAYRLFFGGRRFTADFDVVFQASRAANPTARQTKGMRT